MIAVHLTNPDPSPRQASRRPAALERESSVQFRPLDPDFVSEAIPAFFIGRNREGFWVARDAKGRNGGIFLLKSSALAFARKNSEPVGCATIFPSAPFELDLENQGNPLAKHFGPLMRVAARIRRRMAHLIGG
jgi:hypothetical protein